MKRVWEHGDGDVVVVVEMQSRKGVVQRYLGYHPTLKKSDPAGQNVRPDLRCTK
jgi:hypothetical protein